MTSPRIIAHRGCADQYPENTITAIESAAPYVDMFEIDARPCGTGELVVFHDDSLERVTDGSGYVDETPLAALRELEVLDSGEPIPTLEELLAVVPSEIPVNVELKTTGIGTDVYEVCRSVDNDVLYSSFFAENLHELQALSADVPLAVLCHEAPEDRLELAASLDAVAFHPSIELALETPIVERAHERDFIVNVWIAETEDDVRQLRKRNVDGILADRHDIF